MKRNPKDRGYGYKKSYNYEDSIKESRQKLIVSKLKNLRDDTPCIEDSQTTCGCEKFDEIIDLIQISHTDQEIVDVLFNDFPKVGEQILEFLDNQNE